jgi:hypothetical protein
MSHDVSINIVVRCDICQEEMKQQSTAFVCWPCKNTLYADQLHEYPEQVEIIRDR